MTVRATRVTVGTTATLLTAGPDADRRDGSAVLIRPAADVYVGGPDVTTADGYLLAGGSELAVDLQTREQLYGRAASDTVVVSVLRTGI